MINFIPLILFVVFWYAVAKHFKAKGKGAFIRHITGFLVGALGLIVSAIIIAPKPDATATTETKTEVVASKETVKEEQKTVTEVVKDEPKAEEPAKTEEPKKQEPVVAEIPKAAEQPAEEKATETAKEEAEEEPAHDIGMNLSQFSQIVNTNFKEMSSPFKMPKKPKFEKNDNYDLMSYSFSNNFAMNITLQKKTHNIISVVTIITPSQNTTDNLVMLFSNSALLSAAEGKGGMKTAGKKFIQTQTALSEQFTTEQKSVSDSFIYNGKKYEVGFINGVGIMSSVGSAE
ncbi:MULTISPECIES: hypothetical protein [Haemophilus]|uniref:Uncharacterized protein n=1 Tax=Haemophilus influenzae TaxID=727 RepID=A0ABD6WUS0_HAEIF|nr:MULTISPECIES: hypothetical protein [Haemophilus]EDK06868.1 hypothetical protein CGSHiAA_00285 [Haemophilus influenzae PittAA]KPH68579.1 hypothetical protein AC246_02950 [Haemophilus influenzae]MCK8793590.1 hypothetical protein [Haemophilus influenzae]MCK8823112.1 hypothetical protein [Haemophilus influenzae]MCK8848386.1 hypothetical protein [Haemophilus influenzae]